MALYRYHAHFTDGRTEAKMLGNVAKVTVTQKVVEKLAWAPWHNARFLVLHWPEPPPGWNATSRVPSAYRWWNWAEDEQGGGLRRYGG